MAFRHPYRLFAVLVGFVTFWILSAMFYASRGMDVWLSVGMGYLTLFPTAALFVAVSTWLED